VAATLEQLIKEEQQRQAELHAFAQQLQQQQSQEAAAAAATCSAAAGTADTSASLHTAASNSSSSSATTGSRRVRFSANVDQIMLPQNEGEPPIRISKSLDKPAAGDLEGTVRKGAPLAAAVAAVLGVRWEQPKATANAPYAAHISIDNSSKHKAAAAVPTAMQQGVQSAYSPFASQQQQMKQGVQSASSPFASQQQQMQRDDNPAPDQQQPRVTKAADGNSSSSSSSTAAAQDAAAGTAEQKEGQAGAAAAAAAFSPFGDLKDQPWE
jgi:hypothetical protein